MKTMFWDKKYNRSELNPAIVRNIKRKEKLLDRKCRTTWSFTNPKGQQYLFGSFCKNYDRLIVTIGFRMEGCFGGFMISN